MLRRTNCARYFTERRRHIRQVTETDLDQKRLSTTRASAQRLNCCLRFIDRFIFAVRYYCTRRVGPGRCRSAFLWARANGKSYPPRPSTHRRMRAQHAHAPQHSIGLRQIVRSNSNTPGTAARDVGAGGRKPPFSSKLNASIAADPKVRRRANDPC